MSRRVNLIYDSKHLYSVFWTSAKIIENRDRLLTTIDQMVATSLYLMAAIYLASKDQIRSTKFDDTVNRSCRQKISCSKHAGKLI